MEENIEIKEMLDLLTQPAFFVNNGNIAYANRSAQQRGFAPGIAVKDILHTGEADYAELENGCLYLTLMQGDILYGASVQKAWDGTVFLLEQDNAQTELQALALAAQELRAPLSGVMAAADRLANHAAFAQDSATLEQLAHVNRGLFQILRMVSNMSDAINYTASSLPPRVTRDIGSVCDEIFTAAEGYLQQAQIQLSFTNLTESVFTAVDDEKLERAIYNLLSNSAKFVPKGGQITAKLTRRENYLYLTIQDSGSGVDPEVRANIFTRYLRQPGIEDGRWGIGLGLVLARSVAALHGGTLLVEYGESGGTRFTMSLSIRNSTSGTLHSPVLTFDYAGERNHALIELSDALPSHLYKKEI